MTSARAYDANTEAAITIVTPKDAPACDLRHRRQRVRRRVARRSRYRDAHFRPLRRAPRRRGRDQPGEPEPQLRSGDRAPRARGPLPARAARGDRRLHPRRSGLPGARPRTGLRSRRRHRFQLQYGGVAAQQADAAAHAIAALAGVPVVRRGATGRPKQSSATTVDDACSWAIPSGRMQLHSGFQSVWQRPRAARRVSCRPPDDSLRAGIRGMLGRCRGRS